jgi:hypothetical protein
MTNPKETAIMKKGTEVDSRNVTRVEMGDLLEEDCKVVEQELEEELAEIRRRKLACFQKTKNTIIKKGDTTDAFGTKVNSSWSLEDLVHMVDVSVASKYGVDLTQFTHIIAEGMGSTLYTFK